MLYAHRSLNDLLMSNGFTNMAVLTHFQGGRGVRLDTLLWSNTKIKNKDVNYYSDYKSIIFTSRRKGEDTLRRQ